MSELQIALLAPFAAIHCFWFVCGLVWVAGELSGAQPPRSIADLQSRANQVFHLHLNPFHDRTKKIWTYASWVTGAAWLATAFFEG